MRKLLAILVCSLTLFAQTVNVKKDKFTGQSWLNVECGYQATFKDSFVMNRHGRFSVSGFPGTPSLYFLNIDLEQKDWMFIEKGNSLTFKVDGVFVPLSGDGSAESRDISVALGGIEERASFDITLDQLRLLSSAKDPVQFRLTGSRDLWDGTLSPKAIKAMTEFLSKVPPSGDWTINGVQVVPITAGAPAAPKGLRAGIRFSPGSNSLHVLMVDPAGPNMALLGKFIVAVEGERGSGQDLQTKLNAAIAKHQDGSPVKIMVTATAQDPEVESALTLF